MKSSQASAALARNLIEYGENDAQFVTTYCLTRMESLCMWGWNAGSRTIAWILFLTAPLVTPVAFTSRCACADVPPATTASPAETATVTGSSQEYHTPLAGEPFHTVYRGHVIDIPAQDRSHVTALTIGGAFYIPKQGDTAGSPIGSLYLRRVWEQSRTRDVISIFVNDLEYDRSFDDNLELVMRFDNYTLPVDQTETVQNREIKESSQEWGTLCASVGPGFRYKVAPFQVDNDLRLQLLGRVGYFYVSPTKDTGPTIILPPDTLLYGVKLRGRYDGMRRNLLELPHSGIASGFDLDYTNREKWTDFGTPGVTNFTKSNTRNFLQFSGYVMGVAGIPGLSEKHRLLASIHGGTMSTGSADRYNSFRISGGPLPGESDDLNRVDYPGTVYNQVLASNYVMAMMEYRRELSFFMYLHLRETLIWANRGSVIQNGHVNFKGENGVATTVGIDTGFFWDSELYVAYSWDSGFIRDGRSGSGIIFTWNKNF